MDSTSILDHSKWECKYHVVGIPKYRKRNSLGNCENSQEKWLFKACGRRLSRRRLSAVTTSAGVLSRGCIVFWRK